jgi:large subunit ribosomal protein L13
VDTLSYKTISANKATVTKDWVVVDAENQVLGRFTAKVAKLLRGKYKTNFTPHVDCGDNVIVVNVEKLRMTGQKWTDRKHFVHSGYPGGQRELSPKDLFDKDPRRLLETAIKGMLPKNRLGHAIYGNLKIFVGPEHIHQAQNPKVIDINSLK